MDDIVFDECTDLNKLNSTIAQCQILHSVLKECTEGGWFDYTSLFYCQLGAQSKFLPLIISALILFILFIGLGITADDFLCPSLLAIAKSLKLNQGIVGVTFLAFGNGAPDILTSFAGISQSRPELVIGELFGAGIFVTTIVFGSILISGKFKLMERPLLRDVIFYLTACFFAWAICYQRAIHLWQVIVFIIIYFVYIVTVILGRYIYSKINNNNNNNTDCNSENQISTSSTSGIISTTNSTNRNDDEINNYPSTYKKFNNQIDSLPNTTNFTTVKIRSNSKSDYYNNITTTTTQQQHVNHNNSNYNLPIVIPRISFSTEPKVEDDSIDVTNRTSTDFYRSSFYDSFRSAVSGISITSSIHSRRSLRGHHENALFSLTHSNDFSGEEKCTDLNCMHSPVSNNNSSGRPSCVDDFTSTSEQEKEREEDFKYLDSLNWYEDFFIHISPFDMKEFRSSSFIQKVMTLMKAPFYVILTLTVPVVDYENHRSNWCRLLNSIHCVTGPLFLTLIGGFFFKFVKDFPIALIVALVGIVFSSIVMLTSKFKEPPMYHNIFAYLGFIVSVAWTFTFASEVVNLLKSIGILLNVSDVILGLTVLALGNSLGDFVANLSMARQGFPRIGVSACFGGPLMSKYQVKEKKNFFF